MTRSPFFFRPVALCLLVSGGFACSTMQNPRACTFVGSAVGLVTGMGIGAAIGNTGGNWSDGAIGSGVGLGLGGAAAYYLCRAFQTERVAAQSAPVILTQPSPSPSRMTSTPDPCSVSFELRGAQFDFDKAEIRPDATLVLDEAALRLTQCTEKAVTVAGHTDSVGSESYNQGLSTRRAVAVQSYLVQKGIPVGRLRVVGFGEVQPIATNSTQEGRALNRRVELSTKR